MRDPSRIDRVLHAIRAVWCQLPDFRLGQLILATVHRPEGPSPELYDIEDEELIRTLEHLADRWGLDDPSPVDVGTRLAWDVARLFPEQGEWEAEDYLRLKTNRLVELSDGRLEVLPWPTTWHQAQSG